MRFVIAGATGQLGAHVVEAAAAAGHDTVGISRRSGVDLMTGARLADAVRGADAVIDVSSTASMKTRDSVEFFTTATNNLLNAEREAGVPHHVTISIIGAAEINANYYAGKKAQEDLLTARPEGRSLLRTTQFHGFVRQLIPAGRLGPLQVVPAMRSQPVSVAEVAAELVAIAAGEPVGIAPALAGPQEENMTDLVRKYLIAMGEKRAVCQVPLPGAWGRGMRNGTLLPRRGTRLGAQTFDEWLRAQVAARPRT